VAVPIYDSQDRGYKRVVKLLYKVLGDKNIRIGEEPVEIKTRKYLINVMSDGCTIYMYVEDVKNGELYKVEYILADPIGVNPLYRGRGNRIRVYKIVKV